jgi:hypothetical protein
LGGSGYPAANVGPRWANNSSNPDFREAVAFASARRYAPATRASKYTFSQVIGHSVWLASVVRHFLLTIALQTRNPLSDRITAEKCRRDIKVTSAFFRDLRTTMP